MAAILGYWDVRGLGHSIRLLLEYTGTKYEEKMYTCGPAPDYDRSDWLKEKETLGLDFPNLPYFIDGSVKLTQSSAIIRYIARKHNLCGESEEEMVRVDLLQSQVMDFRMQLATIAYSPDFITFADFLVYDVLDQHRMLEPKCLDSFPNLKTFLDQFEALEKINIYMKSGRFMKTPINGKMAKWCNEK
ncbi:glutathione S-transferase Mu 1-like isoform X2 [Ambystoma mexicanum]|uniref:glutathione S-transferase Mu 1-like isoform X2 n=1 Tax=Ambystoma mexicanum TaxID=8296 RepID=UPI0037E71768